MSEAELHVLKVRLRGESFNKARRGEYHCLLPTGLAYDEAGNVVLDAIRRSDKPLSTSSKRFCVSAPRVRR
jgi:hypothetical protein